MMANLPMPKEDPFSLLQQNAWAKNKEQLTPYKLALMVLIADYHDLIGSGGDTDIFLPDEDGTSIPERKQYQVMSTILDLLQVHMSFFSFLFTIYLSLFSLSFFP